MVYDVQAPHPTSKTYQDIAGTNSITESQESNNKFSLKNEAKDGQVEKKAYRLLIRKIGHEMASKIEESIGVNYEGYSVALTAHELRKIIKDHGNQKTEGQRGQVAITENELFDIIKVITDFDEVNFANVGRGEEVVLSFEKNIEGLMTVIEFVSDKRKTMYTKTAYKSKQKTDNQRASNPPRDANAPLTTSETDKWSSVNNSITETTEHGNENDLKRSLKTTENADTETLIRENDKYRKAYESLKEQFKLSKEIKLNQQDVRRIAYGLIRENNSKINPAEVETDLSTLFS